MTIKVVISAADLISLGICDTLPTAYNKLNRVLVNKKINAQRPTVTQFAEYYGYDPIDILIGINGTSAISDINAFLSDTKRRINEIREFHTKFIYQSNEPEKIKY